MKRRLLRHVTSKFLLICLMAMNLCGCSKIEAVLKDSGSNQPSTSDQTSEDLYPDVVAIIAGKHANSCDISPDEVAQYLMRTVERQGKVIIITSEGNPSVIYQGEALAGNKIDPSWSETKKAKHYKAAADEILKKYEEAMATSSGNDIRKAISLAGKFLSDEANAGKSKLLIVCDTGMGTEAPMDFRGNILSADHEEVINDLEKAHAIPELADTTVIWFGIGAVAAPQPELNSADQENLEKLWEMVLKRGGTLNVTYTGIFTNNMSKHGDLPDVPVIDREPETQKKYEPSWSKDKDNGISLSEESLYFNPDEASFSDRDSAIDTLKPIAKELSEHAECRILLAGCTASVPLKEQWCYTLSGMRADACRDLLIEIMVTEYSVAKKQAASQIETVGLAYHDPWHVEDLDDNGRQTDEATKNRRIVILDYESEHAQMLCK